MLRYKWIVRNQPNFSRKRWIAYNVASKSMFQTTKTKEVCTIPSMQLVNGFLHQNRMSTRNFSNERSTFDNDVVSTSNKAAIDVLTMFPQYADGLSLEREGQNQRAVTMYGNVLEVLSAAAGTGSSPPALEEAHAYLKLKCASLLSQVEDYTGAVRLLKTNQSDGVNNAPMVILSIQQRHLETACYLKSGDFSSARKSAAKALSLCEKDIYDANSNEMSHADISLFSPSYGLMGLSLLFSGSANKEDEEGEVEQYLQMSVRWAETPLQHLQAMTNLGTLHWTKFQRESNPDREPAQHPSLLEALAYWEEAFEKANRSSHGGDTKAAAAAMCGPGFEPVRVSSPPEKDADLTQHDLENALKNEDFQLSYCNLLCNLSEAYAASGQKQRSADFIAAALKSVEGNTSARAKFALGRVLTYIAGAHIEGNQAVSGEGLLRSAISHLEHSKDIRFVYQRAISQQKYGTLLKQWEKREASGEKLLQDASLLLSSIQDSFSESSNETDKSSNSEDKSSKSENNSNIAIPNGEKKHYLTPFFQIMN